MQSISARRRNAAPIAGPAVLNLHRGTYLADDAELVGGVLTFHGRRRERDLQGDRFYEARTMSIRLRAGEWVEWIDRDLVAA